MNATGGRGETMDLLRRLIDSGRTEEELEVERQLQALRVKEEKQPLTDEEKKRREKLKDKLRTVQEELRLSSGDDEVAQQISKKISALEDIIKKGVEPGIESSLILDSKGTQSTEPRKLTPEELEEKRKRERNRRLGKKLGNERSRI